MVGSRSSASPPPPQQQQQPPPQPPHRHYRHSHRRPYDRRYPPRPHPPRGFHPRSSSSGGICNGGSGGEIHHELPPHALRDRTSDADHFFPNLKLRKVSGHAYGHADHHHHRSPHAHYNCGHGLDSRPIRTPQMPPLSSIHHRDADLNPNPNPSPSPSCQIDSSNSHALDPRDPPATTTKAANEPDPSAMASLQGEEAATGTDLPQRFAAAEERLRRRRYQELFSLQQQQDLGRNSITSSSSSSKIIINSSGSNNHHHGLPMLKRKQEAWELACALAHAYIFPADHAASSSSRSPWLGTRERHVSATTARDPESRKDGTDRSPASPSSSSSSLSSASQARRISCATEKGKEACREEEVEKNKQTRSASPSRSTMPNASSDGETRKARSSAAAEEEEEEEEHASATPVLHHHHHHHHHHHDHHHDHHQNESSEGRRACSPESRGVVGMMDPLLIPAHEHRGDGNGDDDGDGDDDGKLDGKEPSAMSDLSNSSHPLTMKTTKKNNMRSDQHQNQNQTHPHPRSLPFDLNIDLNSMPLEDDDDDDDDDNVNRPPMLPDPGRCSSTSAMPSLHRIEPSAAIDLDLNAAPAAECERSECGSGTLDNDEDMEEAAIELESRREDMDSEKEGGGLGCISGVVNPSQQAAVEWFGAHFPSPAALVS